MLILPTTVSLKFSSYDLLWWNDIIQEAVKNKNKQNPKHLESLQIYFRSSVLYVRFLWPPCFICCSAAMSQALLSHLVPNHSFSGVVENA